MGFLSVKVLQRSTAFPSTQTKCTSLLELKKDLKSSLTMPPVRLSTEEVSLLSLHILVVKTDAVYLVEMV
jgi:hypothetical protein